MDSLLPLLFALGIGFTHAFEADHLVAIMNIVTDRKKTVLALKDGIFWGLGHTTTIFIIGAVFILGKMMKVISMQYLIMTLLSMRQSHH